jgi:hypothetical protein
VRVPFDSLIASYIDKGAVEELDVPYLDKLADSVSELEK